MNYDEARQMTSGPHKGKWHWTTYNRRIGTYPSGACANGCTGHDTKEGAEHHYRLGRIEAARFVRIDDDLADALYRCVIIGCETKTASYLHEPGVGAVATVCPDHHTEDAKRELIGHTSKRIWS